jgi:PAS domain S-box-containing protein
MTNRHSLRTKFLIGTLGLVLLLGFGVIILARTTLADKLETQLQQRGLYIARSFAEEAVTPILTENLTALRMLCIDHKTAESDIEYLYVMNSKGDVLAHTFGETFPKDLRQSNPLEAGQKSSIRLLTTEKGDIFDFAAPILKGDLGTVHLGISAEPIRTSVADIIRHIAWIMAGVLAFGSIIAVLFTLRITRPLAELSAAAKAVSSGDLRPRVATNAADEIGQLAATFNKMLDDLLNTTVSRDHMEHLVEERTGELSEVNGRLLTEIEEHTRIEGSLKELNAKLNALLHAIPDAVFFKDTRGRYLMVNRAFEAMSGATPEMFLGKTDEDIMAPDIAACCRTSDEIVMKNGSPLCVEDALTGKAGEKIYLDSVKAPIYDSDGGLLGIVGVSRDVTERKHAAETIERLSRRNEMILESAGEGICGVNLDGIITFANPAAARMTGWTVDDLIGKSQHEVLHHTHWDGTPHARERCRILTSMKEGIVQRIDNDVFWRKDGTSFPVEYVSTPIREDGRIVGAVVVFGDISERRRIEKALLAVTVREHGERARTDAIIAAIGDNISIHDREFKIIYQNQVNKETNGEHVGEHCYRAYYGRDAVCEDCHHVAMFGDGKIRTVEMMMKTLGGMRHMEVTSSPLKDESGKIVAGVELFRDITDRKRAEDELSKANQTLNAMIRYSPLAIICIDTDSNVMIWNPAAEHIFGWREEEVLGRKNPIVPDSAEEEYGRLTEQVRQGEPYLARELVRKRKDGTLVYLSASSASIHDAEGRVVASFALFQDVTERKLADEEIKKTNAQLRTLINTIPDMVIFKDIAGRHVIVNRAVEENTGHSAGDIVGRTVEDLMPPGPAAACRQSDEAAMRQTVPTRAQERMIREDGKETYLDMVKAPMIDQESKVVGLVAIGRDITDRHRMEEALRNSEANYRSLLEQASDGIAVIDPRGRYLDVNSRMCDMLGYSREEFFQLTITDVVAPGEMSTASPSRLPELLEGKTVINERLMRRKDGSTFPMEISAKMLPDGRLCGIHRDITERKQVEEVLKATMLKAKEEKARSEAIISAIGDEMVIIDAGFKILFQNKCAIDNIGDHTGEICHKAFENKDAVCEGCPVASSFADGQVHRGERVAESVLGTMYLDITASPLTDTSGKVIAVIEMVKDITERKRAEEALRRSHDELDILVKERTAELTMLNEQLRDLFAYIQNMREKERTIIAREIHDELGQALTALKIDLSWLKRRLPAEKKPLAEKILSMSELIEATIEAVKRISMELRPGILDHLGLPAAIEWQAGEFQKRTGIRCDIFYEHEDIELDRERSTTIFRVFQETLTNVARHAKAKKVTVTLEEEAADVVLRVEDNGKGISEIHLSDPKSLGLIGMRERVYFWGGKLDIRGTRNKGTEVTVRIPKQTRGGKA